MSLNPHLPFAVVMCNEGGELDRREARDAEHAKVVLAEMVAEVGDLYVGDTFRIEGPEEED
jgi:hypothetical protein